MVIDNSNVASRKYKRVIVCILVVALVAAWLWQVLRKAPPEMYKGKPITAWINDWGQRPLGDTAAAIDDFEKIGPRSTTYVLEALKARNSLLHQPYLFIYSRLPKRIQSKLSPPRDAASVRRTAAAVMGAWGRKIVQPSIAIPALLDALDDDNVYVRQVVAGSLQIARRNWEDEDPVGCTIYDKVAVQKLLIATMDKDASVRINAIGGMCYFTAGATNAFNFWTSTAKTETGYPQACAVYALDKFNQVTPDLKPTLELMLTNETKWIRQVAKASLDKLKAKAGE